MAQAAPRPQTDAATDTTAHVDRVPVGTNKLQSESQDLLGFGSGAVNGSSPRSDWASVVQAGYNAAATALERPEVQAMLAGVIIGGLPSHAFGKTTDGSLTGPKNIPDSPMGDLIRTAGSILAGGDGYKVPNNIPNDSQAMVKTKPGKGPMDGPSDNPGLPGDGGTHTPPVRIPTGDLNKPNKGSGAGEGPVPTHRPGSDTTKKDEVEAVATAEDPLADGVLDIADAERQQQVEELLDRIPEGPVKDLMEEASSQLLETGQLDTEKIQRMLKDAKDKLGDNKFYSQMEGVMTSFSPEFSKQFGIGLSLNRAKNENGDMQDALLVSRRSDSGPDNSKLTILAIPETGAAQVTQYFSTYGGSGQRQLSDVPAELFNTFGNAALEYYSEHH